MIQTVRQTARTVLRRGIKHSSEPSPLAYAILTARGIRSVLWFDNVLSPINDPAGAETQLDLKILVANPAEAATALSSAGYFPVRQDSAVAYTLLHPVFGGLQLSHKSRSKPLKLFPASVWDYKFDEISQNWLPPLGKFVDSLMYFWLSHSFMDLNSPLQPISDIGILIMLCYEQWPEMKSVEWAVNLRAAHRELHYDIIGGSEHFTTERRHEYHVRKAREIEQGLFLPTPYKKGKLRTELGTLSE